MSSYKNESTKNPERKWAKKLRNAKTPEQQKKAENMLKALQKKKKKDLQKKGQLQENQWFLLVIDRQKSEHIIFLKAE